MKRVLLVGSVGCGKTTLLQRLRKQTIAYSKTGAIDFADEAIDTPGEYLELPWFRNNLRTLSFEADLVALLASAVEPQLTFPPGFSTFFIPPVIGVVTKIDVATADEVRQAGELLRLAGAGDVVEVSALTDTGMDGLTHYLV
ncbi:MAG: EutP/PduV family microcompartment system protein [Arachnia sp.]